MFPFPYLYPTLSFLFFSPSFHHLTCLVSNSFHPINYPHTVTGELYRAALIGVPSDRVNSAPSPDPLTGCKTRPDDF